MIKIAKPTVPGIYLYCEEGRCLTVQVCHYDGIKSNPLEAIPMLPHWDCFTVPHWDLDSLNGTWFSIE